MGPNTLSFTFRVSFVFLVNNEHISIRELCTSSRKCRQSLIISFPDHHSGKNRAQWSRAYSECFFEDSGEKDVQSHPPQALWKSQLAVSVGNARMHILCIFSKAIYQCCYTLFSSPQ